MPKNYLLIYSEQLATEIELLCQNIKAPSNTLFQIRKSSSSVYANIREANYGQSKADMLSKFEIALKECSETEGWLRLLFNTNAIDEELALTIRKHIERMEKGVADFAGELELLVDDCKDALMLSGKLDGEALKTEREEILGYLRGKTLILSEYAESDVRVLQIKVKP